MKKAAALIIALSLLLCGCGTEQPEAETDDTKLQIVCSCFQEAEPQQHRRVHPAAQARSGGPLL